MHWIAQFVGRFHPLLVHFPIGILFLAFLLECLSRVKRYAPLRLAVVPTLFIGALTAIASVATGYILSQEGGYENELLETHRNLGIATTIFTVILLVLHLKPLRYISQYMERNSIRILLFLPLITLLSITGHLGGSLTHGEDYLLEYISETEDMVDPFVKVQAIHNIDSAVFYAEIIQPILSSRCYSCHSSRKQKGELRLDGPAFIKQGGKHGQVIDSGIADSSSLYKRLMLPLEDEDHMPPNEKPQPSSTEIALVKAWIEEGATFDKKVNQYAQASNIKTYFHLLVAQFQKENLLPSEEVMPPDLTVLSQLKRRGIIAIPVSKESNYLYVSFVNSKSVSDEDLRSLVALKKQLIWLNLGSTNLSDSGMKEIAQLSALRKLNLDHTSISSDGLKLISPLSELSHLNLVGTQTDDAGLMHLVGFKNLKNVFVYQTKVTAAGIRNYKIASAFVNLDTGGYQLLKILEDSAIAKSKPL